MDDKDTTKGDLPKPKDMKFPMHRGKKFVDNIIKMEKINDILTKQHDKGAKGWIR